MRKRVCDHPIVRRGLTLIELLCALALLGILMAGLSAWLTIAIRDTPGIRARLRFESAAHAASRRLLEDLLCGDFALSDTDIEITIEDSRILIAARSLDRVESNGEGGKVQREYRVEDDALVVHESRQGTSAESQSRTLVRGVTSVRFGLLSDPVLIGTEGVLAIELHSTDGRRFTRTVRWLR